MNAKSAFVTRPKLNDYIADPKELASRCADVFNWINEGKLKVTVDTTFKLDEAAQGHLYLEAGKSRGKVLYSL